jgi:hypothetical protein
MNLKRVYCNYCPKFYDVSKAGGSTDNLWNHFKNKHETKKGNPTDRNSDTFDVEEFSEMLVGWICSNMHPFSIVEEDSFRHLVYFLNKSAAIPSADTIKNKVDNFYESKKVRIIDKLATLENKFSFTLDVWTSMNTKAYLGITIHYVDEKFKINNFLIDFVHLKSNHTGVELGQAFIETLKKFKLENKVNLFHLTYSRKIRLILFIYRLSLLLLTMQLVAIHFAAFWSKMII